MTRVSPPLFAPEPPTWLAAARRAMQSPPRKARLPLWVNGQAVGSLVEHFLIDTGIAGRVTVVRSGAPEPMICGRRSPP